MNDSPARASGRIEPFARERMPGRERSHEGLIHDDAEAEHRRALHRRVQQSDVDVARSQRFRLCARRQLPQLERDVWRAFPESAKGGRQHAVRRRRDEADDEPAHDAFAGAPSGDGRRLGHLEQPASVIEEDPTGHGETRGAADTGEELNAELALELLNLPAEGGLRDVQALRRAGEVSFLRDGDERTSKLELNHRRSAMEEGIDACARRIGRCGNGICRCARPIFCLMAPRVATREEIHGTPDPAARHHPRLGRGVLPWRGASRRPGPRHRWS